MGQFWPHDWRCGVQGSRCTFVVCSCALPYSGGEQEGEEPVPQMQSMKGNALALNELMLPYRNGVFWF